MWTLGLTLFVLLWGIFPYKQPSAKHCAYFQQIEAGRLVAMLKDWGYDKIVSAGALDVVDRMMRVDPSRRATSEELYHHPWLQIERERAAASAAAVEEAKALLMMQHQQQQQQHSVASSGRGTMSTSAASAATTMTASNSSSVGGGVDSVGSGGSSSSSRAGSHGSSGSGGSGGEGRWETTTISRVLKGPRRYRRRRRPLQQRQR